MPNGPGKEPSRSNVVVTHVTASGTIHLEPKSELRPPKPPGPGPLRRFWLLGVVAALIVAGVVLVLIRGRAHTPVDVHAAPSVSASQAPVASGPSASPPVVAPVVSASASASGSASAPPRAPRPRTPKRR
jgi:hypothetical protein